MKIKADIKQSENKNRVERINKMESRYSSMNFQNKPTTAKHN